jgi:hypothetical protein
LPLCLASAPVITTNARRNRQTQHFPDSAATKVLERASIPFECRGLYFTALYTKDDDGLRHSFDDAWWPRRMKSPGAQRLPSYRLFSAVTTREKDAMSTTINMGANGMQDSIEQRIGGRNSLTRTGDAKCWQFRVGRLISIAALLLGSAVAHAAIPASERAVLLAIYENTNGPSWYRDTASFPTPWNSAPGTECLWEGVACNAQGTSVVSLYLRSRNLNGQLPALSDLVNLERLDVSNNLMRGPIPQLDGLTRLKFFVADESFSGRFTGPIPSLQGLTSLEAFICIDCGISGPIPPLNAFTRLRIFNVSRNELSGPIPPLTGLTNLVSFDVSSNLLDGPLPDLSGLENLETFFASGNFLSGGIPDLVDLPKLSYFFANGMLNGQIGLISNLPNLEYFSAWAGQLTGSMPALNGVPKLSIFIVGRNRLSGSVPDLSALTSLTYFNIGYNRLEGSLPAPPRSLVDFAIVEESQAAVVCPNRLEEASSPPSMTDLDWNLVTRTSPWSANCALGAPGALVQSAIGVTVDAKNAVAGEPVTFTMSVWGNDPTGTITITATQSRPLFDNPVLTLCENVPLSDAIARCTVSNIPANVYDYRINGFYSGDSRNSPAGDTFTTEALLKVDYAPIRVVTTSNPAQIGQPVDISGSLAGADIGDITQMTFYDRDVPLCSNVPVHDVQGELTARCVVAFATAGPHSITAVTNTDSRLAMASSDPLIQSVVAARAFDANQFALTGAWYNPVTSGQGFSFQAFADHAGSGIATMGGDWQTFDAAGHQNWFVVQGDMSQSHGATYNLAIGQTAGGNFDALPISSASLVGSGSLRFFDCTHAALSFSLSDGRSGTIPYVRLTPPSACSEVVPAAPLPDSPLPPNYNDVLHSGAWFDPLISGQGLQVEFVPSRNTFIASWVTYAPLGSPSTGIERQRSFALEYHNYTPGDLSIDGIPIIATSGGVFNQPSTIERVQVGTANVSFTSCTTMTMSYAFTEGEFSGLSGTIHQTAIVPNPDCR